MREQDLAGIPLQIERAAVAELLAGLGFTAWRDVAEVVIQPTEIRVRAYATDADGKRYAVYEEEQVDVTDLSEKDPQLIPGRSSARPAVHVVSIPMVGEWPKPAELGVGVDPGVGVLCQEWQHTQSAQGGPKYRMACERYEGHNGDHIYGRNTGRVVGDAPQA